MSHLSLLYFLAKLISLTNQILMNCYFYLEFFILSFDALLCVIDAENVCFYRGAYLSYLKKNLLHSIFNVQLPVQLHEVIK